MQRSLEPEVMDTWEEAVEYDAMDFTQVNTAFAQRAIELGPASGLGMSRVLCKQEIITLAFDLETR